MLDPQDTLAFGNFFFAHPYWKALRSDTARIEPRIRVLLLPSAYLQKQKKKNTVYEFTIQCGVFEKEIKKLERANAKGYDVYYFLNVVTEGVKRATNESVTQLLWRGEDFDIRLPCPVMELYEEFGLKPDMIIETSVREGVHHYQTLSSWSVEDGARKEVCSALGKRACEVLGSDSVFDAKRIMRLPGFVNWKGVEAGGGQSLVRIDYNGGEPSPWAIDEVQAAATEFATSVLGKTVADLYAAARRSATKAVRATGSKDDGELVFSGAAHSWGSWKEALKKGRAGKPTAAKGERHNALVSWAGQIVRDGIAAATAVRHVQELARVACAGSYGVGEDSGDEENGRDLNNILASIKNFQKKDIAKREEEMAEMEAGFATEIGEEEVEEVDLCGVPKTNGVHIIDDQKHDTIIKTDPSVSETTAPDSAINVIKELETALLRTEAEQLLASVDGFAKTCFMPCGGTGERAVISETTREWGVWIKAVVLAKNYASNKKIGGFNPWIELIRDRLKKLYCYQGRYYSVPVSMKTAHGEQVRYMRRLGKDQGAVMMRKNIEGLSRVLQKHRQKIEGLFPKQVKKREEAKRVEEAKGDKGKPDKADDLFTVLFSASGDTLTTLVKGLIDEGSLNCPMPQAPDCVVFQNGIFSLSSGKFKEDKFARLRTPHAILTSYVPRGEGVGEALLFDEFLEDAFPDDPATHTLIYCMLGYCFTADNPLQKVFTLSGVSGSGKSTLAGVMLAICGVQNATVLRYGSIGKDTGLGGCVGKTLAVVEEAEADRKTHLEAFSAIKQATSGEAVSVRNLYSDPVMVQLGAKFLLLTNKDFGFDDAGGAASRRIVPIQFDYAKPIGARVLCMRDVLMREHRAIASRAVRELAARWRLGEGLFEIEGARALASGRRSLQEAIAPLRDIFQKVVVGMDARELRTGGVDEGIGTFSMAPGAVLGAVVKAVEIRTGRRYLYGRPEAAIKAEMTALGYQYSENAWFSKAADRLRFRGYLNCKINFSALLEIYGVSPAEVVTEVRDNAAVCKLLAEMYDIGEFFDEPISSPEGNFRL